MTEVFERLDYVPTKEQQAFHDSCQLRDSEIILVAGRAWGKTTALFMEALKNADELPGVVIVVVGQSQGLWWGALQSWKVVGLLGLTLNATTHTLKFPNGSSVRFDPYSKTREDAFRKYGGAEIQGAFFDGDVPWVIREYIAGRIRTHEEGVPIIGTRRVEDGSYRIYIGHPLI